MCKVCVHEAGHMIVAASFGYFAEQIHIMLPGSRHLKPPALQDGGAGFAPSIRAQMEASPEVDITILCGGIAAESELLQIEHSEAGSDLRKIRTAWERMNQPNVITSWDDACLKPYRADAQSIIRNNHCIGSQIVDFLINQLHPLAERHPDKCGACLDDWFAECILPRLKEVTNLRIHNPAA